MPANITRMAATLACMSLLASCSDDPRRAQIIFALDGALGTWVRIQVLDSEGQELFSEIQPRSILPEEYPVVQVSSDVSTVRFVAELYEGVDSPADAPSRTPEQILSASAAFEKERVVYVPLRFANACTGVRCIDGQSCFAGECVGECYDGIDFSGDFEALPPQCGSCELCSGARCIPRLDGEPCGCPGAQCQSGRCIDEVLRVATGRSNTCAIRGEALYCWGTDALGLAGNSREATPTLVANDIMQVATNGIDGRDGVRRAHTCALRSDGSALCWGDNDEGQLGVGDRSDRETPSGVAGDRLFTFIDVGGSHSCAIDTSERLWCWGRNDDGQLGVPASSGETAPRLVDAAADVPVSQVCAGRDWSCALSVGGEVRCFGRNRDGALGRPDAMDGAVEVVALEQSSVAIACGQRHACAVAESGEVFCWGSAGDGRLGQTLGESVSGPVRADFPSPQAQVACGGEHCCSVGVAGGLWCWGSGEDGQLGLNEIRQTSRPLRLAGARSDWSAVKVGARHSCAVRDGAFLLCWGSNSQFQTTVESSIPALVCIPVD